MRKTILFIGLALVSTAACSQGANLKELTSLLELPQSKLENHLQKRGFKPGTLGAEDPEPEFIREDREKGIWKSARYFRVPNLNSCRSLSYGTTNREDYLNLQQELKDAGYYYPPAADSTKLMFQRHDIRVECRIRQVDSLTFYEFCTSKKSLPKAKEIAYAEDLLQLDAQEYVIEVFGRENVKTDVFYFSDTETNKCSILFPNTPDEAIFVWNDETNLKDLAFIVFGGDAVTRGKKDASGAVSVSNWHSKQGLRCGMSLREVQALNGAPFRFYNWHTENAGCLANDNKGSLNFRQIGLVFNCMNCAFLTLSGQPLVDSEEALAQNQKVFVNTLIVLPEKGETNK